jgi:hypothetical protein
LIIFIYICILLRFLVKGYMVFMDSAGKRTNTEGAARGKRRLDEEKSEQEPSKKLKLDDSESDLTSLDSEEIDRILPKISGDSVKSPLSSKKEESEARTDSYEGDDSSPAPAPAPAPAPGLPAGHPEA